MKKSAYIELRITERKYGISHRGALSINGMDKPSGSKLSRKAGEHRLGCKAAHSIHGGRV